jgi:hypothetical protein
MKRILLSVIGLFVVLLATSSSCSPIPSPGYGAKYGELTDLFHRADIVVAAQVMRRGDDCPDPIRSIPGPGYVRAGRTSGICQVFLSALRIYKGTISQSEITASYNWAQSQMYAVPYDWPGRSTLIFLCNGDSGLIYCPAAASSWILPKDFSRNVSKETGLNAIYEDAIAGLTNDDDNDRLAPIFWALGVGEHAQQLIAARQLPISLHDRMVLDACLIQADDIDDIVLTDIKSVSTSLPPHGIAGDLIFSIQNSKSPLILDLAPIMIKANSSAMDEAVRTLIDRSRDPKYAPIIASFFSDQEPAIAFHAMTIMEHLTGHMFPDKPAFWKFNQDPTIRSSYTKEWQQWWQANRHYFASKP